MSAAASLRQRFLSFRNVLFGTRADKLLPSQAVSLLFEAKVPFYAEAWFAYGLVLADVGVVANMCYTVWNDFTQPVTAPTTSSTHSPAAQNGTQSPHIGGMSPSTSKPDFQLRPVWQRAGLSAFFAGCGAAIATLFLYPRRRLIRRLYFLPDSAATSTHPSHLAAKTVASGSVPAPGRQLFVQTVHHLRADHGHLFPMSAVKLQSAERPPGWMELWVQGIRGKFELAIDGARLNGDRVARAEAEKVLLQAYTGRMDGDALVKRKVKARWTKGPMKGT